MKPDGGSGSISMAGEVVSIFRTVDRGLVWSCKFCEGNWILRARTSTLGGYFPGEQPVLNFAILVSYYMTRSTIFFTPFDDGVYIHSNLLPIFFRTPGLICAVTQIVRPGTRNVRTFRLTMGISGVQIRSDPD